MNNIQSSSHTLWDCKYHLVWIPRYRKKILFGQLQRHLGDVLHELASHKQSKIHEGHMKGDHLHTLISIPPKYAVSQAVSYIKVKRAIHIARQYMSTRKNFTDQHFWARGYCVSKAGRDEEVIRQYIKKREEIDRKIEQLGLFKS